MKTPVLIVLLILFLVSAAYSASLDELSKCVVFIKETQPVYEEYEGRIYEVWRKDVETGEISKKHGELAGLVF